MVSHRVTTIQQLRALYPTPVPRALAKESAVLTPGYAEWIAASPFCVIATRGADGIDCSPRGDRPGFVQVADERTLLIPDRRGNNRLDTLANLLADASIGVIFLVPGVGETVRVRGTATISTDPDLLARTEFRGVRPVTVLQVQVHRVYFQCRRAVLRSALWDPAGDDPGTPAAAPVPSAGRLQQEVGVMDTEQAMAYDAGLAEYTASTLYTGPSRP